MMLAPRSFHFVHIVPMRILQLASYSEEHGARQRLTNVGASCVAEPNGATLVLMKAAPSYMGVLQSVGPKCWTICVASQVAVLSTNEGCVLRRAFAPLPFVVHPKTLLCGLEVP